MLRAFQSILAVNRRAAASASTRSVEAVHQFRKSIRRARAIVELLRPALGERAADGLVLALKKAFAETGSLRDADILLAALASLGETDITTEALEAALKAELADRPGPAQTAELLRGGGAGLRPLPGVLEVVLPADFSVGDLHKGFARTQRRARRALSRALESYSPENFHRWRRRMKDLRYQVELLASGGSKTLRHTEKELGRLAQDVGDTTDLFVLGREVEARAAALPDSAALAERIRRVSEDAARQQLSRGEELLAEPPRRFADRVLAERG
jgi:CHAD domain-containing protein